MATFNGERFIERQLDSLADQSLSPYELVVCDDGSSDATVDIVRAFAQQAPFPVCIVQNPVRLGYRDNFLQAASLCKGEWVAYCDQDDIWHRDKLMRVAEAGVAHRAAVLIVHSAEVVDETLCATGRRVPDIRRRATFGPLTQEAWWVKPGFCCTFRRALLDLVDWHHRGPDYNKLENPQAHDQWVCYLANIFGDIIFLPESLVMWRRHREAITYEVAESKTPSRWALRQRRDIDAAAYRRMADSANAYMTLLLKSAPHAVGHRSAQSLRAGAAYYGRMCDLAGLRASLYRSSCIMRALQIFLTLIHSGGYASENIRGFGVKGLIKDCAVTFLTRPVNSRSGKVEK